MKDIPKTYDQSKEDDIYKLWELSGYFNPDNLSGEPFTIIMPPPNATGTLHIGHAYEASIQDTVIRYQRMRGKKALWLPGTDHAAIATNTKVEKILIKEEDKNRHDIGREAFVKKVEDFVEKSRGTILAQLKTLGASADWTREAFTMDEKRSLAVKTAFKKMYDDGLIYQGTKVINWDPKGQTAVSDDEVVYKPEQGQLYIFKYCDWFPIEIATTRPETKVGDTAVAVHPDDPRYENLIGKEYNVEFAGVKLKIKIIADESVDPKFGTGAVGVTPAHSMVDNDLAAKHELPSIQVIDEYGKMMENAGSLIAGKKTKEARGILVDWLSHQGLLRKIEFIDQNIATAERSGGVIEPLPKLQWFINVTKPFKIGKSKITGVKDGDEVTLKFLMKQAVEGGQINILPERYKKIYFNWIDNLRDWNISRQLWYGHRIPIYYKNKEVICSITPPKDAGWEQDPDTLDTWFSSALWTFSSLGWPEETDDLKLYHPTSFMCPGYEIIFFWVARMVLMSTYHLGEVPFLNVYLHGIVRDIQGKKFSKSLDNGIDPVEVVKKYGADALRMSLMVGVGPGNDTKYDEMKVKGYRNFANKIWNASRFVTQSIYDMSDEQEPLKEVDQKIIDEVNKLVADTTKLMDQYDVAHAAENLYHFFWHRFADEIIEESKKRLEDPDAMQSTKQMLSQTIEKLIKLLHPFMPFVTEVVWQQNHSKVLMVEPWPALEVKPEVKAEKEKEKE
jgi:valyl-tRNA synthetase